MSNYHMTHYSWAILVYGGVFIYRLIELLKVFNSFEVGKANIKNEKIQQEFQDTINSLSLIGSERAKLVLLIVFVYAVISQAFLWPICWPMVVVGYFFNPEYDKRTTDILKTFVSIGLSILFFYFIFN